MTKYSRIAQKQPEKKWNIHPIWRGIGCLMLLMIPLVAYVGGIEFSKANDKNQWVSLPKELRRQVTIPYIRYVPVLDNALSPTVAKAKYSYLFFGGFFTLLGFFLTFFVYAALYRVAGPPRYKKYDSPPVKRNRQVR